MVAPSIHLRLNKLSYLELIEMRDKMIDTKNIHSKKKLNRKTRQIKCLDRIIKTRFSYKTADLTNLKNYEIRNHIEMAELNGDIEDAKRIKDVLKARYPH